MTAIESTSFPPAFRMLLPSRLGEPGSLEAVVDVVLQQGYRISQVEVTQELGEIGSWKPSVDTIYGNLIPVAYEKMQFHLAIRDTVRKDHLQLRLESSWNNNVDQLSKQQFHGEVSKLAMALFNKKEFDPAYYTQRLLDLCKHLYSVLQPQFGWLDRCHRQGYTTDEHVNKLGLPHLYWANFFGPAYVQSLGKEFLLEAPAGRVEKLGDGGILYVLDAGLKRTSQRKKVEEEAKLYFGIS
jgi:hypothetical protein